MSQAHPKSGLKIIILIFAAVVVVSGLAAVGFIVLTFIGMRNSMSQYLDPPIIKSASDEFQVSVKEIKSGTNSLSEHIIVTCTNNVEVGIEVVDLAKVGVSEVSSSKGDKYFRIGHPFRVGTSGVVHVKEKTATCDISYNVIAGPDKASWSEHFQIVQTGRFSSEKDGGRGTSTIRGELAISNVRTNWPANFPRGSWVPLADLGPYKIMVTLE